MRPLTPIRSALSLGLALALVGMSGPAPAVADPPPTARADGALPTLDGGASRTAVLSPVDTVITAKPRRVVKTKRKRVTVRYEFTARARMLGAQSAQFACSMDGGKEKPCRSGVIYKVKRGKHTFRVAATLRGRTDPSPAKHTFKVKKKNKKKGHHGHNADTKGER